MVYVVPNSHHWSSLAMLRHCIEIYDKCDKQYLLTGIDNTIALGYRLERRRPLKAAESRKTTPNKRRAATPKRRSTRT